MSRRDRTVRGDIACPTCQRQVTGKHFLRDGTPRCTVGRFWTLPRLWKLMELTDRGWSDQRIADHLATAWDRPVSRWAVEQARERHGIPCVTAATLSALEVARLLGIGYSNPVNRWLAEGWLKGRRGPVCGARPVWMVTREALWDFVEDPEHWHRWDPDRIADPKLRRFVDTVRCGERYLSSGQAVDWLREHRGLWVTRNTVAQWALTGHVPSRVADGMARGKGRHVNRRIPLSALRVVEPPPIGSRPGCGNPKARLGRSGHRFVIRQGTGYRVVVGGRYVGYRTDLAEAVSLRDRSLAEQESGGSGERAA